MRAKVSRQGCSSSVATSWTARDCSPHSTRHRALNLKSSPSILSHRILEASSWHWILRWVRQRSWSPLCFCLSLPEDEGRRSWSRTRQRLQVSLCSRSYWRCPTSRRCVEANYAGEEDGIIAFSALKSGACSVLRAVAAVRVWDVSGLPT